MLDAITLSKTEVPPPSWSLPCRLLHPSTRPGSHRIPSAPNLSTFGTTDTFSVLGVPRAIRHHRPARLWALRTSESPTNNAGLLPASLAFVCWHLSVCLLRWGLGASCSGAGRVRAGAPMTGVGSRPEHGVHLISPSAARLQCPHFLLHQHRGRLHPLPGRGLPETSLPGDPGVHPGATPLSAGEPAAGE